MEMIYFVDYGSSTPLATSMVVV